MINPGQYSLRPVADAAYAVDTGFSTFIQMQLASCIFFNSAEAARGIVDLSNFDFGDHEDEALSCVR